MSGNRDGTYQVDDVTEVHLDAALIELWIPCRVMDQL